MEASEEVSLEDEKNAYGKPKPSSVILNLARVDPFDNSGDVDNEDAGVFSNTIIHVRVQARGGWSHTTTVTGLDDGSGSSGNKKAIKAMTKRMAKTFNCSVTVKPQDESDEVVLVLTGDQRVNVKSILVGHFGFSKEQIIVH